MISSAAIICHPFLTLYTLALHALSAVIHRIVLMITTTLLLCITTVHLYLSLFPSVHAAGAKVKDLEDEADRLLEKLQPIKKLQDNLRRNISQIKELINQARKQANSVGGQHTDMYDIYVSLNSSCITFHCIRQLNPLLYVVCYLCCTYCRCILMKFIYKSVYFILLSYLFFFTLQTFFSM